MCILFSSDADEGVGQAFSIMRAFFCVMLCLNVAGTYTESTNNYDPRITTEIGVTSSDIATVDKTDINEQSTEHFKISRTSTKPKTSRKLSIGTTAGIEHEHMTTATSNGDKSTEKMEISTEHTTGILESETSTQESAIQNTTTEQNQADGTNAGNVKIIQSGITPIAFSSQKIDIGYATSNAGTMYENMIHTAGNGDSSTEKMKIITETTTEKEGTGDLDRSKVNIETSTLESAIENSSENVDDTSTVINKSGTIPLLNTSTEKSKNAVSNGKDKATYIENNKPRNASSFMLETMDMETTTNGIIEIHDPVVCEHLEPAIPEIIEVEQTYAVINWKINQSNSACIPIIFNGSCYYENSGPKVTPINGTISPSAIVTNVTTLADTKYICYGQLMNNDTYSETSNIPFTSKNEPWNFQIIPKVTATEIALVWDKPPSNLTWTYRIIITRLEPNHFVPNGCILNNTQIVNTTRANVGYNLTGALPDYVYSINITANSANATFYTNHTMVTTNASDPGQPLNISIKTVELNQENNTLKLNLTWQMPCDPNGILTYFSIKLLGYYIEDVNFVDSQNFSINATRNQSDYSVLLYNIMPASNYSIRIEAVGKTGEIGDYTEYSTITEDNYPGQPNVSVTETGPYHFNISWQPPQRRAGKITNYLLNIKSGGPNYDQRSNCPQPDSFLPKLLNGTNTTYIFESARPHYNYVITVSARTSKGDGKGTNMTLTTITSAPEEPDDLTFNETSSISKIIPKTADTTTGILSWTLPCSINGPIAYFNISLSGNYTDDNSIHHRNLTQVNYTNHISSYNIMVQLKPAYNYEVSVTIVLQDGKEGKAAYNSLTTKDGYPGRPIFNSSVPPSNTSFKVNWKPPIEKTGAILNYEIYVSTLRPRNNLPDGCYLKPNASYMTISAGSNLSYEFTEAFPFYEYSIKVRANTSRGYGDYGEWIINTTQSVPENVRNFNYTIVNVTSENYDASATISFDSPCYLNGAFGSYWFKLNDSTTSEIISPYSFNLSPEKNYTVVLETKNEMFSNWTSRSFTAPAGVPKFSFLFEELKIAPGVFNARIKLRKTFFSDANGLVRYLALILSDKNVTGGDYGTWNVTQWPEVSSDKADVYYQITEDNWEPFIDSDEVTIDIGNTEDCRNKKYCNKTLESSKDYYLIVRIMTNGFYKNSAALHFITDDVSKLGSILGCIFGLFILAIIGLAGFIAWKKKMLNLPGIFHLRKSSSKPLAESSTSVSGNKFIWYCTYLENNPEKFKEQFALLTMKAKEISAANTTNFASFPENRRKNRWINVLPFDQTRVKLLIDEEDEIASDYINASYIKGFSGHIEYIASQGPLHTTSRDFWKMVVQENVTIIVMVTQFIENNKDKCYRYFPKNHETQSFGDDIEVKCSVELHFGTHCIRTLQVRKDSLQVTVTHMQFLEWPDFGVPQGTENMLQFCYQLRERSKIEGGCIVVHCSAGVGRTGTLIAADILLQMANAGRKIDIFNTVLELRKQRINMVQTETQYMYIHSLIKDHLDLPPSDIQENSEPVYENMSVIQDQSLSSSKKKEAESKF